MWSPKEELCKDTYDPCRHYASEQLSVELGEEGIQICKGGINFH